MVCHSLCIYYARFCVSCNPPYVFHLGHQKGHRKNPLLLSQEQGIKSYASRGQSSGFGSGPDKIYDCCNESKTPNRQPDRRRNQVESHKSSARKYTNNCDQDAETNAFHHFFKTTFPIYFCPQEGVYWLPPLVVNSLLLCYAIDSNCIGKTKSTILLGRLSQLCYFSRFP